LKRLLERKFLAGEDLFNDDDDVNISHQVAALSADDSASIITQLLTYVNACLGQLQHQVSYVQCG